MITREGGRAGCKRTQGGGVKRKRVIGMRVIWLKVWKKGMNSQIQTIPNIPIILYTLYRPMHETADYKSRGKTVKTGGGGITRAAVDSASKSPW
jgi:hypothetical protein